MSAAAYDYHYSSSKRLLPKDELGKRFLQYFYHGWSFIEAPVPEWGERPNWRTEKRYPIGPRNLWKKHQDPGLLLGLSFDKYTNYFVLDIDRKSRNHPENSRENFDGILYALESIGMCRVVAIYSSESEGIHLYYFLPYPVYSLTLAIAVKQALFQAGFRLKGGQLEIFPNPKPYDPDKKTSYLSHRLPLQKNSFLLDWDLQPISDSVETLLDWADETASSQDMEPLSEAMKVAEQWCKAQYYLKRGKNSAEQFCWDLEEMIEEGWTDYGQTNELLLTFAKYGIIFKHHLGEDLVEYMLETALSSPGYTEFCRHQHEIEKRVRERATSALNYPYYPYRGKPPRKRTYKEQFGKDGVDNVIYLHPSRERHAKTMERIRAVVAMLRNEGTFPQTAYKRTQAIIKKSKTAFEVGVSQTTLYKEEYLPLWHPAHENREGVNADSCVEKYPILPDPWETVSEQLKSDQEQLWESLHVPPYYEGLCLPPAKQVGGLGESVSDDEVQPQAASVRGAATSNPEGEIEASNDQQQPQAAAWSSGQRVIFLHLCETEIIPNLEIQDLEIIFLYLNILGIFSTTEIINPTYFNFLIEKIHSESGFYQFNDKGNLSSLSGGTAQKPDNLNLSIPETVSSPGTEGNDNTSQPASEAPTGADNAPRDKNHSDNYSTPSSPLQTPHEESSNSPSPENVPQPSTTAELFVQSLECSTTAEHFSDNDSPRTDFTHLEYRIATRHRLKAQVEARRLLQVFCNIQNISLMPRQRQELEQLIKYHLMNHSPSTLLKQEAVEWFTTHCELVTEAQNFKAFWDYLQNLPIPDF
ncbi:MAG: hypothetical protein HC815_31190 [Richelia sp. RM1_1_1]|nr:hypothetical protein [Richelia sp. RM1_1_1]